MILDDTVIIPQHISRHAFCSAQFFLFDSFLAFVLEYRALGCILFSLYISTMLHWNCVRRMSVIKIVDIVLAATAISRVTFFDSARFSCYYQNVWNVSVATSLIMFMVNEILFYFQVHGNENPRRPLHEDTCRRFHYFSLEFTVPNSCTRESAYYRSVYTHMLFLHVLPTTTCALCACRSLQMFP
jgi:hypothetical protein